MSETLLRKAGTSRAELINATRCPRCKAEGQVRQSQIPMRSRYCPECGFRWRTLEVLLSVTVEEPGDQAPETPDALPEPAPV